MVIAEQITGRYFSDAELDLLRSHLGEVATNTVTDAIERIADDPNHVEDAYYLFSALMQIAEGKP